ncbi:MAG: hypothetical protein H7296_04380 [Bacteroidia bacterium]|nr:hypothetical protein [Bacteroidia bacterium]
MKLFNFVLLNMLLLGGLSLSTCNKANAAERPEAKKIKAICTEIKEKVPYPDELLNLKLNEKVIVEFKVKEDKTIEVIAVETLNNFLKLYVKKQLENIQLNNLEGVEGKTLQLMLLFTN